MTVRLSPTFALLELGCLCRSQLIIARHALVVIGFSRTLSRLPSASPVFCNELDELSSPCMQKEV